MSSNRINRSLLAVILSLAGAAQAEAQSTVGVRANGMGGAFVGVADDASAVYWNPAGLATGQLVSLNLEFGAFQPAGTNGQDDLNHALLAIGLPPVGLAYYRQGVFGERPPEAAVTTVSSREEVRSSVHTFTTSTVAMSLLHSLSQYFVVSVTPKVVWGGDSTTADLDASAMMAVSRLRLGVMARHLSSPAFDFDGEGLEDVELATEVRVGGGWGSGWPGHSRVVVAVDGDVLRRTTPSGERRDLAAGVETWWLARRLGVRGGWRGSTVGETRPTISAGASAAVGGFFVDGYVAGGRADERSWGLGLRFTY